MHPNDPGIEGRLPPDYSDDANHCHDCGKTHEEQNDPYCEDCLYIRCVDCEEEIVKEPGTRCAECESSHNEAAYERSLDRFYGGDGARPIQEQYEQAALEKRRLR
jgi:hypothetical protein